MKSRLKCLAIIIVFPVFSMGVLAIESVFDYWQEQWEEHGYPDDIGGQYRAPDGRVGILVVDPSPERIEELGEVFGENVLITPCKYSFNELKQVNDEIRDRPFYQVMEDTVLNPDSKFYTSGIGWGNANGSGFGESGFEFRVVVDVDESVFERYTAEFAELYDDKVLVRVGSPIGFFGSVDDSTSRSNSLSPWLIIPGIFLLLGGLSLLLWRKLRGKSG